MKTFILLSDIHACNVDPEKWDAPSFVSSNNRKPNSRTDPIMGLDDFLEQEQIKPDYILCAGDITNRSEPTAFTYVWQKLHNLSDKHGAKLISTVGNHDLDSRFKENKFDPRGFAMSMTPKIPIDEREQYLEFWAENFTIIHGDDCNLIVLNTAAYHGYGKETETEVEHGRISDVTISKIEEALRAAPSANINILLCHHHPIKDQGDSDLVGQTRGGEQLVEALENADSTWIIIHGHKHIPDLFYGHGGGNSPVVLGCASFSAQVTDSNHSNPNQFHLLTCVGDVSGIDGSVSSAGTVKSWNWIPGAGWAKAAGLAGLPHEAGFGYRGNPKGLASKVEAYLQTLEEPRAKWSEVVAQVPQLSWLTPKDFAKLETALSSKNIAILRGRSSEYLQVGIS